MITCLQSLRLPPELEIVEEIYSPLPITIVCKFGCQVLPTNDYMFAVF